MAELHFSDRMEGVSGSAIREIFKIVQKGNVISFAGGNPNPKTFPQEALADISARILRDNGAVILQYGQTEGWAPLYESIWQVLKPRGINPIEGGILPLTGSSQGIELFTKLMINPGDVILAEAPTFLGALQTFFSYQANVIGVKMDDNGMDMEDLERKIKAHHPKFIYTIPTFQNPTGVCLSNDRRQRMAELAAQYGVFILEDDPYCELRYLGDPQPSIMSFDQKGLVIHLMTFSKTVSPGLRLGAAVGNPTVIRKMVVAKQGADVHTANLNQAMVDAYIREGHYFNHVREILPSYKAQMEAMLDMFSLFPPEISYTRPSGGLFIWVELPEGQDAQAMLEKAVEAGVAYVPGQHFYAKDPKPNTMRLNFSASTPEQIRKGMEILANLLKTSR
ncbi:PLP-dependent aminotransferase family protein [Christensenella sp. MSJ-20]|uniref:aminotransferase-like domain-containing protein n=1 Tax=Christensenella sp. MSJ-20 TaxID=2841518 RepID=UPI000D7968DC|nr:MAG: aminotransferase [Bacillota bacterium]QWT54973.1 PLP-dependent aminotransferase family protein [Christensenella sp. MSJ-20]